VWNEKKVPLEEDGATYSSSSFTGRKGAERQSEEKRSKPRL
jgi:hypothetical protein